MSQQHPLSLSVVIATLGGDVLGPTLAKLNSGDNIPAEILVCVPEKEAAGLSNYGHRNVRVIATPCRGQVSQRAYGLRLVVQSFVMQMDDDIIIEPATVEILLSSLKKLGPGNVIAPLYRHLSSGQYITQHLSGWRGLIFNAYLTIICGAPWGESRMGRLTATGMGYWVDRSLIGNEPFETEWVPGGCVLSHRQDLVTDNYFPFPGKAFSEDLIHSIYWRRRGIHLWAIPTADCRTKVDPIPFDWRLMRANFRAHAHVVSLIKGTRWRLYAWFAFFLVLQSLRQIVQIIKKTIVPLTKRLPRFK